jgi:hypothetical protein
MATKEYSPLRRGDAEKKKSKSKPENAEGAEDAEGWAIAAKASAQI